MTTWKGRHVEVIKGMGLCHLCFEQASRIRAEGELELAHWNGTGWDKHECKPKDAA